MRTGITAALLVIAARAGAQSTLSFTLPPGPFAVGFRAVEQYDHTRTFGGAFDEDGKPVIGERARPIQTSIWYPSSAPASAPRMRYRDYVDLYSRPGTMPAHDARGRAE